MSLQLAGTWPELGGCWEPERGEEGVGFETLKMKGMGYYFPFYTWPKIMEGSITTCKFYKR